MSWSRPTTSASWRPSSVRRRRLSDLAGARHRHRPPRRSRRHALRTDRQRAGRRAVPRSGGHRRGRRAAARRCHHSRWALPPGGCATARARHPHVVKVVRDRRGTALYFSRAPIPVYGATSRFPRSAFTSASTSIGATPCCGWLALPPDAARARRVARAAARARARHPHSRRRERLRVARGRHPQDRTCDRVDHRDTDDVERRPDGARRKSRDNACVNGADGIECNRKRPTKYIFVTGGVVSSLGKGLAAASIGALLEGHGYKVALQKFDPYINVDPGTMSPYQHGEVYVTDDGAETDLDLGHYERFTNTQHARATATGPPARSTCRSSRRNAAATTSGGTVQVIPHITNEIKDCIRAGRPRRRRRARRDRRHGRRHREPAVPRGDSPVPPGRRPREHALHPPDAGAVHRVGRRAEDQAHAAQRARPALDRHPARHPAVPHRPPARHATSSRRSRCSATSTKKR